MRLRTRSIVLVVVGVVGLAAGALFAGLGVTSGHYGALGVGVLLAGASIVVVGVVIEREARRSDRRARHAARLGQRLERMFDDEAG